MPSRIIFPEKGHVALQVFELPPTGEAEVRVRTLYSLMSIGTETTILHQRYDPGTHFDRMFSFPQLQTGVQAVGVIEEVGPQVAEYAVGDRVFMRMAHRSHAVLAAELCSPVPDAMDSKQACWCGLAKTAFRAAWAAPFEPGCQVLIIGAGPVGQMTTRWAHAAGVDAITVVDLSATRLKHAIVGGATTVLEGDVAQHLEAIADQSNSGTPTVVVDTTGNPVAFQHALAAAPQFGKVILLGDTGYPGRQCLTSDLMTKGLTVQAVHDSHDRDGWTARRTDAKFFASVLEGSFNLSGLISREFSPMDCEKAYALAEQNREDVVGILYNWSDAES